MNDQRPKIKAITINLAGYPISMKIPENEESFYRQVASFYNVQIDKYNKKFPSNDTKKNIALASFECLCGYQTIKDELENQNVDEQINTLSDEIEQNLNR